MATKTEIRASLKARFQTIGQAIAGSLAQIATIEEKARREVGVYEVRIGMAFDEAREGLAEAKAAGVSMAKVDGVQTDDWREYARLKVEEKSVTTLYRWQNAGAVARVLAAGQIDFSKALVGSLVPLYRILTDAQTKTSTPEDLVAAKALVCDVYSECQKAAGDNPPGEPEVLAAAQKVCPATKGKTPAKGKTEGKTEGQTDEGKTEGDESRRESSEGLTINDPVKVEEATKALDSQLRQWRGAIIGKPLTDGTLQAIMLATCRLAGEHGPSVLASALSTPVTTKTESTDTK